MSWIIKDHYEDLYDFEADKMALESMDITAFSCSKLLMIEVPVKETDIEKISQIYELLFPGLLEDITAMNDSKNKDPYKISYFYKKRSSDSENINQR